MTQESAIGIGSAAGIVLAVALAVGSALGGLLQRSNAELVFELDRGLTVGYRGFYTCDA